MFDRERVFATVIFLVAMGLTLYVAFAVQSVGWVIVTLIIQALAMAWYCLSYIPYGREMIEKMCCALVKPST